MIVTLVAIEVSRSNWKPLTKEHLGALGERLSSTRGVIGAWTAVEDDGTSRRVERLQAAVLAESPREAADYVLQSLSDLARRHRLVLGVSWFENPSPDAVPVAVAETLGLPNTVNDFVTVGEVFSLPSARTR
jgi:hypothetical protein